MSVAIAPPPAPEAPLDHEYLDDIWLSWCSEAGLAALPAIEALNEKLPNLEAVMLSTLDGFNICALGVAEEAVGRSAALASSLHAVSTAAAGQGRARGSLDYLTLVSEGTITVYTTVAHDRVGSLLLWARGTDIALGMLLHAVRAAGAQIAEALHRVQVVLPPG